MTRIAGKSHVTHKVVSSGCGSAPAKKPAAHKTVSTGCGSSPAKKTVMKKPVKKPASHTTVSTGCGSAPAKPVKPVKTPTGGRKTTNIGCG